MDEIGRLLHNYTAADADMRAAEGELLATVGRAVLASVGDRITRSMLVACGELREARIFVKRDGRKLKLYTPMFFSSERRKKELATFVENQCVELCSEGFTTQQIPQLECSSGSIAAVTLWFYVAVCIQLPAMCMRRAAAARCFRKYR